MLNSIKQKIIEGYCEELDKFLQSFLQLSAEKKALKLLKLSHPDNQDILQIFYHGDYLGVTCYLDNGFTCGSEKFFEYAVDDIMTEFVEKLKRIIKKGYYGSHIERFIEEKLIK